MHNKTVLDNGLRVVTYHMPHMESTALGLWVLAGGRYEEETQSGISHFIEHLLFKGTSNRTGKEIKEAIEGVGGSLNAFTSEEFTCYLIKIVEKYFKLSLDVLSDMVLNPLFKSEDIEKERLVILEEIRMYLDLPMQHVHQLLSELLWPNQPLGRNLSGTKQTIASIRREDILNYHQKMYHPSSLVVAASGPLEHKIIVEGVKEIFSQVKPKVTPQFKKAEEKQDKPRSNLFFKPTEQSHISLGFHALSRLHPDYYGLNLLHIILGANMSSRLFQEVRENRGLAYEIGSAVRRYQDTGIFAVNAGVDNKKAPEAIKVILDELKKITLELVLEKEFLRAKEFYIGQMKIALEDTMDRMLWSGENEISLNREVTIEEVIQKINQVRIEDILRLARDIFRNNNLNLALIGPVEDKDKREIEKTLTSF